MGESRPKMRAAYGVEACCAESSSPLLLSVKAGEKEIMNRVAEGRIGIDTIFLHLSNPKKENESQGVDAVISITEPVKQSYDISVVVLGLNKMAMIPPASIM